MKINLLESLTNLYCGMEITLYEVKISEILPNPNNNELLMTRLKRSYYELFHNENYISDEKIMIQQTSMKGKIIEFLQRNDILTISILLSTGEIVDMLCRDFEFETHQN